MPISTARNTSGFFHKEWDVGSSVSITRPDGSMGEARLNFHRINLIPSWRSYVGNIISALGWQATDQIAIVGATFGMFEELARAEHGFSTMASCDDSLWIQAAKAETEDADINSAVLAIGADPFSGEPVTEKDALTDGGTRARVPILNESLLTQKSWSAVRNALGGQIKIVFTDDLLDRISDAEAVAFSAAVHSFSGSVLVQHAVGNQTPNRENAKGATAWKALLPADTFVDWSTSPYQVL
jgi:hypothetical protein